ncbi:tRNA dihydrouridine synthase DusB [Methylocystis parvus]|uniref:tRNA-dihydrouridine synthase n=1 Tax=Methylocystis parvus TaxID=134 RepID=A0A6B8MDU4_9HYPH|nr:tRNA dihydrouridine synthase DusB [Methylocystis parvus]QGM99739.1 tRNA dihydrouridine synthase DusB [Methylocystis parvus]WBK02011.1 tRNA dihydrouridine synthase DusB [Methylocystis parvus OBBP]
MTSAENVGADMRPPLQVGPVQLSGRAFLAPMAGVTDPAMRRIAERFGASAAVSEMITAAGVARGDRETALRLASASDTKSAPRVIQIAARDRDEIAAAARCAEEAGADWVDINMGCPCKRVTGGLAGAALMRDLNQAAALIAAARNAIRIPLSVKMRLGWDDATRNAAELARRAEAEGASLVTVHGRTRQQFYTGRADWAAIAAVKQTVAIPVVANGDCGSPQDAAQMLALSGADAVMVGRAAQGRPWLVGDIAHYLATGRKRHAPGLTERGAVAREHLDGLLSQMGAGAGLRHARKHLASYVDDAFGAESASMVELRRALVTANRADEAFRLIDIIFSAETQEAAA